MGEVIRKQLGETNTVKHNKKYQLERKNHLEKGRKIYSFPRMYFINWNTREKMIQPGLSVGSFQSGRILGKVKRRRRCRNDKYSFAYLRFLNKDK
jgi:hypothetical protein